MIEMIPYSGNHDLIWSMIQKIKNRVSSDAEILEEIKDYTFWIDRDESGVTGMICGIIKNRVSVIAFCFAKNVCDLLDTFKQWSIECGAKKIIFLTKRNPMPFVKKHKFKLSVSKLEMEL